MDDKFAEETERLKRAWDRRRAEDLAEYLVQDVQDPRINVQSILARHFLVDRLFGDEYVGLMAEELRFATVMNWLMRRTGEFASPHQVARLLDGLLDGRREVDGLEFPQFMLETFERLPIGHDPVIVGDYISEALIQSQVDIDDDPIPESTLNTFGVVWEKMLRQKEAEKIRVLEVACGSANDYRFIEWFGIGRFLQYRGIDLCEKNVANAKELFADVDFVVGNAMEIEAEDGSYDCCIVSDLFEHLSPEAMEKSFQELCRVTKGQLCLGFFNMGEQDEHVVQARHDYHWNLLSRKRVVEWFERVGAQVETVNIDGLLRESFGFDETLNKGAYTLAAWLEG